MNDTIRLNDRRLGFTLIELLIVIAILAILIIISMMSWRLQIEKANDAKKKEGLYRISQAFEEYFSDNECYPAPDTLQNCGGSELSPYLDKVPCDPVTKLPYCYIADEDNPGCGQNFRILTPLKYQDDPVIANLGCDGETFCGYEEVCSVPVQNVAGFNYGVSSTNITVANPAISPPGASASPQASGVPQWYCSGPGNCTGPVPAGKICSPSYDNVFCNPGACAGITSNCTDL